MKVYLGTFYGFPLTLTVEGDEDEKFYQNAFHDWIESMKKIGVREHEQNKFLEALNHSLDK